MLHLPRGFIETRPRRWLVAGHHATGAVREEWPSFGVLEVDQQLAERAAGLALAHDLGSLDALHLAAALLLSEVLVVVT